MADVKIDATEAKQLAMAAAQGVAIALTHRRAHAKEARLPPHIVCGYPPFLYEAQLVADAEGNVAVTSLQESRG